jgi:hypothetical protein
VPAVLATATGSDWNAGGSIITFYFPVGLFVVIAVILYLLFSRPHKRVPGRGGLASAHAASGAEQAGTGSGPGDSPARGTGHGPLNGGPGDGPPPAESSNDDTEASG